MKSIVLSVLGLLCLQFSLTAQDSNECTANVEALQKQIRILATELGDEEMLAELDAMQAEQLAERELKQKISICDKDPNPFEVSQEITLSIPEEAQEVEVVFSNALGQQIKVLDIDDRGETHLKIYMAEYLKDSYNYTLVVDGVPTES